MTERLLKAWTRASASQIKTFLRCPSRWYANKVLGLAQPESEAMRRGKRLHTELERWLLSGDVEYLSPTTRPVVELGILHPPVEPESVERRMDVTARTTGTVPILGFIDLEDPDTRTVTDHKTTSSWTYMRTSEELSWDPQAILYCHDALDRWGGLEPITFRHIYYRTKNSPAVRVVDVELSVGMIRDRFRRICSTLESMQETAVQDFADVTANLEACSDYGGCPYRTECARAGKLGSPFSRLNPKSLTAQERSNSMNYAEMLAARRAQQSKPAPATPEEVETPEPQEQPQEQPQEPRIVAAAVNPPDGTPMDKLPEPEPEPEPKKARGVRYGDALVSGMKKSELVEAWQALSPSHEAPELEWDGTSKVMRTTLVRDVTALVNAGCQPTAAAEPVAEETAPEEEIAPEELALNQQLGSSHEPAPVVQEAPEARLSLYVGCVPRGRTVVYLDQLLRRFQQLVEQDAGVPHYSLIPYAEGPKRVAAALRMAIADDSIQLPAELVVDRRHPCADAVLDVILPLYGGAGDVIERMG